MPKKKVAALICCCVALVGAGLAERKPPWSAPSSRLDNGLEIKAYTEEGLFGDCHSIDLRKLDQGRVFNFDYLGIPHDALRSMKWDLRRGLVVVFYEHPPGPAWPGPKYVIWGRGQDRTLSDDGVDRNLSAVSWHDTD